MGSGGHGVNMEIVVSLAGEAKEHGPVIVILPHLLMAVRNASRKEEAVVKEKLRRPPVIQKSALTTIMAIGQTGVASVTAVRDVGEANNSDGVAAPTHPRNQLV